MPFVIPALRETRECLGYSTPLRVKQASFGWTCGESRMNLRA